MNVTELEVEMLRYGDKDQQLADALGISRPSLIDRKTGKVDFRRAEIDLIQKRYSLAPERVVEIFLS